MYSVDLVNGWDNSSLRAVRHGVSACKFQAAWDMGSFVKILEDTYSLGAHQMQVLRLQEAWDVEIIRRERQDSFWVGDLEFTSNIEHRSGCGGVNELLHRAKRSAFA
jgi:hypothetical protein